MEIEAVHPVFEPLLKIIARQSSGGYEWAPSERDIEIYHAVTIHHRPQREVAAQHELSQTRIRQLLDQVGKWLAQRLPQRHGKLPREEQLNLAVYIERERLEYLYGQAVVGWQNSLQAQATYRTRQTKDGPLEERTVRSTSGRPQYLREAARLARDLAALEGVGPATYAREAGRTWNKEDELNVEELSLEQQEARLVWMEEGLERSRQLIAARLAQLAAADAGDKAAKEQTRDYDREALRRDQKLNEYLRGTLPEQWREFRKRVAAARGAEELDSPDGACSTSGTNDEEASAVAEQPADVKEDAAAPSDTDGEPNSSSPEWEKQVIRPAQVAGAAAERAEHAGEPPLGHSDPTFAPQKPIIYYGSAAFGWGGGTG